MPWAGTIQAGQERAIRLAHSSLRMLCTRCGHRGADVRPDRQPECAPRLISEQPACIRAARPYRGRKTRFPRAIEIEGGPRRVMSYDACVFISSPQQKARRLLEAAENGERENIDRFQALDWACVHVPGTHDQASAIGLCAVKSSSCSETFCERAQVLILLCFRRSFSLPP